MMQRPKARAVILTLMCIFMLSVPKPVKAAHVKQSPSFTPWDVEAASQNIGQREQKPYTIMIYMNGSDLESESGAATDDLLEILDSGLDSRNAHVVLFTGGTLRWQNDVVPDNECALWEIADGWLYDITGLGTLNMGDPGTLSSFIQFGMKNFPADKYGLILWDHGGGSIAGYGHDEKFMGSNLTLLDLQNAFESAGLKNNKLEFLGFDSCLMGTVEMAVVASDYVHYLIASEDLEPGDGWDYYFLSALNRDPQMDGKTLGVAIVDYFVSYYGPHTDEIISLSVIDLSKAKQVMETMGRLMSPCSDSLLVDRAASFRTLAGKRVRTKTFGEGSPRDNECDMVDIGDMAVKLSDLYPNEAAEVLASLESCVVYNRHNSDTELKGLSTYYIYGGKTIGRPALDTYAALDMNADYTGYLYRFFDVLTGKTSTGKASGTRGSNTASKTNNTENDAALDNGELSGLTQADIVKNERVLWKKVSGHDKRYRMMGLMKESLIKETDESDKTVNWPAINGYFVSMYPVNHSQQNTLFAIPAEVNGRDCDIMVLLNERHPKGIIQGLRNKEGIVIQKGYDPIKNGDRISFYYMERDFNRDPKGETHWHKAEIFTVDNEHELILSWKPADDSCYFGLRLTDLRNEAYYTEPHRAGQTQNK